MKTTSNFVQAMALIVLGLAIGVMGVYVGSTDDAPGASLMGFVLLAAAVAIGVKTARNRLPAWIVRTALAVGIAIAMFAAWLAAGVATGH